MLMDCWQQSPPDDPFNMSWTGGTAVAVFEDIIIGTYFFLICFECTELLVGVVIAMPRPWMANPHSFQSQF